MTKTLVTGAAGFLGSHLVDALLAAGQEVVGVDNFCTGNKANLAHLQDSKQFKFHELDVSLGLGDLTDSKFDSIFHLASPASPPHYMELALETMQVNTTGTQHLLKLSQSTGARLLFASTSEIYGDPLEHPQNENYWGNVNPIGPRSVYDEAKRFGETLLAHYEQAGLADTVIIRIFNTYGPRLDSNDGRVVSSFLRDGILGKPLQVFGDGKQTRSFCFVSDLITGIIAAMDSGISGPVNLGNPNEFTLLELAEKVGETLNIEPVIEFQSLPTDDPRMRCPDISYAKSALGWEPNIELTEGLALTAQWLKTQITKS
jgi:nucleoside-diphosphate-sugar epimerase